MSKHLSDALDYTVVDIVCLGTFPHRHVITDIPTNNISAHVSSSMWRLGLLSLMCAAHAQLTGVIETCSG